VRHLGHLSSIKSLVASTARFGLQLEQNYFRCYGLRSDRVNWRLETKLVRWCRRNRQLLKIWSEHEASLLNAALFNVYTIYYYVYEWLTLHHAIKLSSIHEDSSTGSRQLTGSTVKPEHRVRWKLWRTGTKRRSDYSGSHEVNLTRRRGGGWRSGRCRGTHLCGHLWGFQPGDETPSPKTVTRRVRTRLCRRRRSSTSRRRWAPQTWDLGSPGRRRPLRRDSMTSGSSESSQSAAVSPDILWTS